MRPPRRPRKIPRFDVRVLSFESLRSVFGAILVLKYVPCSICQWGCRFVFFKPKMFKCAGF